MSRDFTLEKYRALCQAMVESGYRVLTVSAYLEDPDFSTPVIILRHDVDRKPHNALKMAHIEKDYSIASAYYFRKRANTFKPDVIRDIANLGHEIGYHYETLVKAGGDFQRAIELFHEELDAFRAICPVKTICMHGSPFSRWNNRDLWKRFNFEEFDILGETYLSFDFRTVNYYSDTGRTWHSQRYNIRDRVAKRNEYEITTTEDLIHLIHSRAMNPLYILVHPNRWAGGVVELAQSACSDFVINQGKMLIQFYRMLFDNSPKCRPPNCEKEKDN